MAEDFKLPFDPSILMEYINSNAMMIAIILLVTIVTLVGFAKLKHSIVPVGIAIIAACQVVQVIQMVFRQYFEIRDCHRTHCRLLMTE